MAINWAIIQGDKVIIPTSEEATQILADLFSDPARTDRELLALEIMITRRYPGFALSAALEGAFTARGMYPHPMRKQRDEETT